MKRISVTSGFIYKIHIIISLYNILYSCKLTWYSLYHKIKCILHCSVNETCLTKEKIGVPESFQHTDDSQNTMIESSDSWKWGCLGLCMLVMRTWGGGNTGFQKVDDSSDVWTIWRKGTKWDEQWRLLLVRKERTSKESL